MSLRVLKKITSTNDVKQDRVYSSQSN